MKCPKCTNELMLSENEGHIGYRCVTCKGIWLPNRFLKTLDYRYQFDLTSFVSTLKLSVIRQSDFVCPSCANTLDHSIIDHVTLEYCAQCHGVWFDQDELAELITHQKDIPIAHDGLRFILETILIFAS